MAICSVRARSRSMRRAVNAFATTRRTRVCSGGSSSRMLPGRPRPGRIRGSSRRAASARLNRGSPRTVLTSSYRVTSQAASPYGKRTRHIGSLSRSSANSGSTVSRSAALKGNVLGSVTAMATPALRGGRG